MPWDSRLPLLGQQFDTNQVLGAAEQGQKMANLAQSMGIQRDMHQITLADLADQKAIMARGGTLEDLLRGNHLQAAGQLSEVQQHQAQIGKTRADASSVMEAANREAQKHVATAMSGATQEDWDPRRTQLAQEVFASVSPSQGEQKAREMSEAIYNQVGEYHPQKAALFTNFAVSPQDQAKQGEAVRHNRAIEGAPRITTTGTGQRFQYNSETGQYDIPVGDATPARSPNGAGSAAGDDLTPEALEAQAQAYRTTGVLPRGLGTGKTAAQIKMKIINRAAALDQAEDGSDIAGKAAKYAADASSLKKYTSQADAMEAAESTAQKNGEVLESMLKELPDGGSSMLNKPLREFEDHYKGDPRMTAFHAALLTFRTEAAKVLSGSTGNAAPTDSSMKEVEKMLPENGTVAQIRAGFQTLIKDMGNRHSAVAEKMADFGTRTSSKGKKTTTRGKTVGGSFNLDAPPASASRVAAPPGTPAGYILVSNGQESHWIDPKDEADAAKDNFKRPQ